MRPFLLINYSLKRTTTGCVTRVASVPNARRGGWPARWASPQTVSIMLARTAPVTHPATWAAGQSQRPTSARRHGGAPSEDLDRDNA